MARVIRGQSERFSFEWPRLAFPANQLEHASHYFVHIQIRNDKPYEYAAIENNYKIHVTGSFQTMRVSLLFLGLCLVG
jgi:hypothetical protein